MKQIYLTLALFVFATTMSAQTFEYSLSLLGTNPDTGNYEVALLATPDFDETNGNSADMGTVVSMTTNIYVQSAGFVNDCINSGPPNFEDICEYPIEKEEWAANYLSGPSTASSRTVFSFERTETGESTFFDAVNGTPVILAVFQIYNTGAGLPTTGDITLIENGDPVLNGTPNHSYFNIKYITVTNNITTDLYSVQNTSANSINFATLSIPSEELIDVSLFPNPTKDVVTIRGVEDLKSVEVFNINGQRVLSSTSNLETINMSVLQSGMYFAKLSTEKASTTIKLIKE